MWLHNRLYHESSLHRLHNHCVDGELGLWSRGLYPFWEHFQYRYQLVLRLPMSTMSGSCDFAQHMAYLVEYLMLNVTVSVPNFIHVQGTRSYSPPTDSCHSEPLGRATVRWINGPFHLSHARKKLSCTRLFLTQYRSNSSDIVFDDINKLCCWKLFWERSNLG